MPRLQEQFKCPAEVGTYDWFTTVAYRLGYFHNKKGLQGSVNKLLAAIKNGEVELTKTRETAFPLHTERELFYCRTEPGTLEYFQQLAQSLGCIHTSSGRGSVGKLLYAIRCKDIVMIKKQP